MSDYPLIATKTTTYRLHHPDIGPPERTLSALAGGALLVNALRSGGVSGALQAVLGAYCLYRGASGHCIIQRKLKPTPFEQQFQRSHGWQASEAITRSVTVAKPLEEVLDFLKQPVNIGPLIPWVDTIEAIDERTSKWTAHGPMDQTLTWTLQMEDTDDTASLQWRTLPEGKWQHVVTAQLKKAPGNRGTEVKLVVVCEPAGGKFGYALASAISAFSDKAVLNLLGSLKQQLETGEVSTNQMRSTETRDFMFLHVPASAHEQSGPANPGNDHPTVATTTPTSAAAANLQRGTI